MSLFEGVFRRLTSMVFIVRTLLLIALTMSISGVSHAVAQPARSDLRTSRIVDSLVKGDAAPGMIPSGFSSEMGYNPISASGTLRNPNGACSTPGEIGPAVFDGACQTHDLGYDLLRYAEKEGARLGAKARLDLDWKLYVDLLEVCESTTCSLTATAYYCAVSANSIRQGYKAPHTEPTAPWMAIAVGILGISAVWELPTLKTRFDARQDNRT